MKIAGTCLKTKHLQWQIQDFSGGGGGNVVKGGCPNLLFWPFFPENCMKLTKIGQG